MAIEFVLRSLLPLSILGAFLSLWINRLLIGMVDSCHGEEEWYQKEWDIVIRWVPISQHCQHLTAMISFALFKAPPLLFIGFTAWHIWFVYRKTVIYCSNSIHRTEKIRYLDKKKTKAPDEIEAAEALLEKVMRDARPHYRRFAWISSVFAVVFIFLRMTVFV